MLLVLVCITEHAVDDRRRADLLTSKAFPHLATDAVKNIVGGDAAMERSCPPEIVADGITTVDVERADSCRVRVRAEDRVPHRPGSFVVSINGERLPVEFGATGPGRHGLDGQQDSTDTSLR